MDNVTQKQTITISEGNHTFSIIDTTQGFDPLEQRRYLGVKWNETEEVSPEDAEFEGQTLKYYFRGFWLEIQGEDPIDVLRSLGTHILRMVDSPVEYELSKGITPTELDPYNVPVMDVVPEGEAIRQIPRPEEVSKIPEEWVDGYYRWVVDVLHADLRGADLEIELLEEQLEEARGLAQRRSQWWSDYWRNRIQREQQSANVPTDIPSKPY